MPLSSMIMRGQPRLSMVWPSSRTTRKAVSEVSMIRPMQSRMKSSTTIRTTEALAAGQCVHHEVERPAQVLILRVGARVASACLRPPRLRTRSRSSL